MSTFKHVINQFKQNMVIAYPTEAVFGLGCDPSSNEAILNLLKLKQRSSEKGLILIAHQLDLLLPYIDQAKLLPEHIQLILSIRDKPTTWVVPAKATVSKLLTGKYSTIGIRICQHPDVVRLCEAINSAVISTSANLVDQEPCRTFTEVQQCFGQDFPILEGKVGSSKQPSEIIDVLNNQVLRQG